jgi:hypothetical protein
VRTLVFYDNWFDRKGFSIEGPIATFCGIMQNRMILVLE